MSQTLDHSAVPDGTSGGKKMNRTRLVLRIAVACTLLVTGSPRSGTAQSADLTLVPYVVEAVRVPRPAPGHLLIHNRAVADLRIERVLVTAGRETFEVIELDRTLSPSPDFFELAGSIEQLPVEFTERHRARSFADPSARERVDSEIPAAAQEIAERLTRVRERIAETGELPFLEVPITVPYDRIFDERPEGAAVDLEFDVSYKDATGASRNQRATVTIERLAPFAAFPKRCRPSSAED